MLKIKCSFKIRTRELKIRGRTPKQSPTYQPGMLLLGAQLSCGVPKTIFSFKYPHCASLFRRICLVIEWGRLKLRINITLFQKSQGAKFSENFLMLYCKAQSYKI